MYDPVPQIPWRSFLAKKFSFGFSNLERGGGYKVKVTCLEVQLPCEIIWNKTVSTQEDFGWCCWDTGQHTTKQCFMLTPSGSSEKQTVSSFIRHLGCLVQHPWINSKLRQHMWRGWEPKGLCTGEPPRWKLLGASFFWLPGKTCSGQMQSRQSDSFLLDFLTACRCKPSRMSNQSFTRTEFKLGFPMCKAWLNKTRTEASLRSQKYPPASFKHQLKFLSQTVVTSQFPPQNSWRYWSILPT